MPANITLGKADFTALIRELKDVDKQLINELRKSFRTDLKPINEGIRSTIKPEPPLSGFAKGVGVAPFVFGRPTASVKVSTRVKPGRAFANLVSSQFTDRRPNAGFSILETAGSKTQGTTPQGRGMIRALNSAAPMSGGLGRFVIPAFKKKGPEIEKIARDILDKFSKQVNRKLKDGR